MKPSQVAQALNTLVDIKRPAFLWGPPGVGKSDIVAQVAKKRGIELRDVRLSLLDPTDLKGFPCPDLKKNQMRWLPADFLPREGTGVLFLDEMNSAPQAVQAAGYQLILNRRIGDYELPDGWTVIAAGNRAEDRSVTHRMPAALANRLVHIDFDVDLDDFVHWAMDHGMTPEQIAFHRFRPNLLHSFDSAQNPRAFPSPRAWTFVDQIRKRNGLPQNIEYDVVSGTVGEGAAAEYYGFMKTIRDLPTIDEIKINPDGTHVPESPATLHALTTSLAMATTDTSFSRFMQYVNRMPVEFQVVYARDAIRRDERIKHDAALTSWALKNHNVMI